MMNAPSSITGTPEDLAPASHAGAALVRALSASLDALEKAAADPDPVEMVHDARKAMKEYRALLRLVPDAVARVARRHSAEAARAMSHARDRATAHEALDLLDAMGLLLPCDLADARAAVGDDATPEEAERHRASLAAFLAEAREQIDGALGAAAGMADVGEELEHSYRRARSADFGTPEAMHEARKRVVAHRYQMSFIATAFAGRGAKRARKAQRLRDFFGAYQDLETLRPMLHGAQPALAEGTLERLDHALKRAQAHLRKKALRRHAALFRRKPEDFRRHYRDIL
ncbi:CHAD domain-containing protein [Xanthobacter dioxanivorans]|uniref:CHAD domain-containing protein n=1 Tax=Xanthobacter dioxanivorans TaxID=2528964 RepID=A0A974PQ26_9HYPH|nr:CHAD domain-containing protein [Xanthobacter dioxanivorans]QRG07662.1 CHAD domain-containing protein [Xanthobacter dioxanivorans]